MNDPCERCGARGLIRAYWGPILCRPCIAHLVAMLDEHDAWPSVPWGDDEEALR